MGGQKTVLPGSSRIVNLNSFPIQDEPEGLVMLGSERQRASGREVEFGGDSPVRRGQRGNPV